MRRLLDLEKGESGTVISIVGGMGIQRRLNQMGLHVGDRVRVVEKAPFGGPVVVEVHGSEFVLGRGVAAKIMVDEIS